MNKLYLSFCVCLWLIVGSPVLGDSVTEVVDISCFDNLQYEFHFETPTTVLSIDSIEIEFSHDNVEQVQIFLENVGEGTPYVFFTLVNGLGAGDAVGNRIGAIDGDYTDLQGLASLTFVESGSLTTVRGSEASPVMTGEYLAEDWENHFGSGQPPYSPTQWRVVVRDNTFFGNDKGALGRITVNFTTEDFLLGDVNLDGVVDLLDVGPFVDLIVSGDYQVEADINQDGAVDLLDVSLFIDLLTN